MGSIISPALCLCGWDCLSKLWDE